MEIPIIVIILASFGAGVQACNIYSYNQCANTFFGKYPEASKGLIPDFKGASMDNVCNDFHELARCAKPFMEECSEANELVWKVSKNGLNYMCSEGSKKVLESSGDCLRGADLTKSLKSCNKTMQDTLAAIVQAGSSASLSEICSAITQFRTCSVSAANTYCGSDASKWVGGFVDTAMEPAKNAANCMSATNMVLIFGVSAGIIFVLSIIAALVRLAVVKRKKQNNPYGNLNVAA